MYLSRIPLDITDRNTMRALSSPSIFHGAISDSFVGGRPDVLWRIDNLNNQLFMLILSIDKPDLTDFSRQFSNGDTWETKDYDQLIERIKTGSVLRFRLTSNPTKSVCGKNGKRGKVTAHITTEHQKNWLINKGAQNGFSVNENSFDVVQSKWHRFYKHGNNYVTILSVTYEGILEITDAEKFKAALAKGIGRGKAYGMGLMTVMNAVR
ncbi:MAG: type I-E CRISPR-associated protein Cas6/Cse3/CasE [Ruminococcus sp.]|uniref:type I-E CRISPR-associated protein Cas6/Cse3/CasE n=1 Tax=Ruminococcus sp. TaxID=41978 RepID=UPI0025D22619|nr:type I-E CRISPR-associated protein Cas6/Cse3/CasE [Ruminococcus sp.]MBO4865828.1 type I-E CRISPR-associated protein Cas6/Cse3/CasE [Ruminococcus sp.]